MDKASIIGCNDHATTKICPFASRAFWAELVSFNVSDDQALKPTSVYYSIAKPHRNLRFHAPISAELLTSAFHPLRTLGAADILRA